MILCQKLMWKYKNRYDWLKNDANWKSDLNLAIQINCVHTNKKLLYSIKYKICSDFGVETNHVGGVLDV